MISKAARHNVEIKEQKKLKYAKPTYDAYI